MSGRCNDTIFARQKKSSLIPPCNAMILSRQFDAMFSGNLGSSWTELEFFSGIPMTAGQPRISYDISLVIEVHDLKQRV